VSNILGKYILEGHTPVPVEDDDKLAWARWFENADRHVAEDRFGAYRVSTIFLGLDHRFGSITGLEDSPPILFETMVFGRKRWLVLFGRLRAINTSLFQRRYFTWEQAERGHRLVADRLRRVRRGPFYERRLRRALAKLYQP
jgi:hypothetical protein